jgi:hypothetical protein
MAPIESSFVTLLAVLVAYQWLVVVEVKVEEVYQWLVVVEVKVEEVYQQMVAVEVHQLLVVLEV